jgi:archaellum biogenesis protein FlaJ (TadC family)
MKSILVKNKDFEKKMCVESITLSINFLNNTLFPLKAGFVRIMYLSFRSKTQNTRLNEKLFFLITPYASAIDARPDRSRSV